VTKTVTAWRRMVGAIREDHAMLRHYDAKYAGDLRGAPSPIARDLVTRIGFQMLAACRVMRFFRDAEVPLAPQVASRLIRYAYGSDIHWDAELSPGIVIVHGMGMAVSHAASVERGVILSQGITLGMGTDPVSRAAGAPHVEQGAHLGAGSTFVGPITVGARSKVTANCFVRTSIPQDSLVEAPAPVVSSRAGRDAARRSHGENAPDEGTRR